MLDRRTSPPGPRTLPFVGKVLRMGIGDILNYWIDVHGQYGDVVKSNIGPLDIWSFAGPEALHEVLVTKNRIMRKGFGYSGLRMLLGEGLITTDMPHWADQRNRLNPLFTPAAIDGYAGAVYDALKRAIDELTPPLGQSATLDLSDAMTRLTMRVISGAAFGVDLGAGHQDIAEAINFTFGFVADRTANPLHAPLFVPTPRNRTYARSLALINDFVAGLIEQARRDPDPHSMSGQIFEALKDNDDKRLRDEVISLYFAGYETTARSMTFALHLVARHPELLTRLHSEASQFKRPDSDISVLRQLPLAAEIINETLRLFPPVAIMARQPSEDCTIAGYIIRKNSLIVLVPFLAQRHAQFWPDPERFAPDPARPLAKRLTHKGAFLPFGAGPRICLGKQFALVEMTIALAMLARELTWTTSGPDMPDLAFAGTIRPKQDLSVTFSRQ